MCSRRSFASDRGGFGLVELLVAAAVLGVMLAFVAQGFGGALALRRSQTVRLQLQQNLRSATQLLAQDARSGAIFHVWHDAACPAAGARCSDRDEVSLVVTDGHLSPVPSPPGRSFGRSREVPVCDARGFRPGDVALLHVGAEVHLLEVGQVQLLADHARACAGSPGTPNRDKIGLKGSPPRATWDPTASLVRAEIVTYRLEPDPHAPERTVLARRVRGGGPSGIVAFDIVGLEVAYGIPVDPEDDGRLVFHDTLESAARALGPSFSAVPGDPARRFVGLELAALRVTVRGESPVAPRGGAEPDRLAVTQTIDFRIDERK